MPCMEGPEVACSHVWFLLFLGQVDKGQVLTAVHAIGGTPVFSRRVVGWRLDQPMDAALVVEALNQALGHRLPRSAERTDDQLQHVGERMLLEQHCGGELLLHPETGAQPR